MRGAARTADWRSIECFCIVSLSVQRAWLRLALLPMACGARRIKKRS